MVCGGRIILEARHMKKHSKAERKPRKHTHSNYLPRLIEPFLLLYGVSKLFHQVTDVLRVTFHNLICIIKHQVAESTQVCVVTIQLYKN